MRNLSLMVTLLVACILALPVFSQNVIVDYQAWAPSGPPCNIFGAGTAVPATIGSGSGNVTHYSLDGNTQYNTTQNAISLATSSTTASPPVRKGTRFRLDYNFKAGYRYIINVTAAADMNRTGYTDGVFLRADRSNSGLNNGTTCGGPVVITPDYSGNPPPVQILTTAYSNIQFAFNNSLSAPLSSLEFTAMPASVSSQTIAVYIRKIEINETLAPPQFTVAGSPASVPCGSNTNVTFTATNVNFTPGITAYTWDLGSSANGWEYAGSPAPQFISTTTNTLTLTSLGGSLNAVKATVTALGTNYVTNAATTSIGAFSGSISGSNLMCSTTASYSVIGLPAGATVTWSAIPTGVVSISTSGNTANLTKIINATVNITATVNACGTNVNINKGITVGVPEAPTSLDVYGGGYEGSGCIEPGGHRVEAVTTQSNTGYEWTLGANLTSVSSGGNNPFTLGPSGLDIPFNISGAMTVSFIKVRAINACGFSDYTAVSLKKCTSSGRAASFSVSPNPGSGPIMIRSTGDQKIYEAQLIDKVGNIRAFKRSAKGDVSVYLEAGKLPADIYYVKIYDGDSWTTKQVIIHK